MSALKNAKLALAELQKTTLGYKPAKKANPDGFVNTHQGRCEAALRAVIAELAPAPPATVQLPETYKATHSTDGLAGKDGWPFMDAIDVFAKGGTVVLAPADGVIDRLSGHPVTPTTQPGGPYGLSCYLKRDKGGRYYLTHFATLTVHVGERVKKGQPIGTVADYSKATNGVTPSHIHQGFNPAA